MKALQNSTNKIHYQLRLKTMSVDQMLLLIDRKCKDNGDYKAACEAIKQLEEETHVSYDKFFKNYLKEIKDYEYVYDNLKEIHTVEDAVLKIVATIQLNDKVKKQELLSDPQLLNIEDNNVKSLLQTLK